MDECPTNIALAAPTPGPQRGALTDGPRNWGRNVTLVCSLSAEGIGAAISAEGVTDGTAFGTYAEHFLLPTLQAGQVAVMDNLQVYKSARVRELIEGAGVEVLVEVLFLPPYSLNFSPIEEAFSKVEGILRRTGARTPEALVEPTGRALDAVSRQDALGWFAHCGYRVAHHLL